MTTPPSETGEQEGLWSLRLAQILCAPTFAFPFLYLLLWVAHRLPSKARDGIGLLFFLSNALAPTLAAAGLVVCLVAGSRGKISPSIDRRMWRLFLATAGLLVVLYSLKA